MAEARRGEEWIEQPEWFTPGRLLLILCVINMINYVDRGMIASNGVNGYPRTCEEGLGGCVEGRGIQGDFELTYFQDGVLSSAFMVGLLVASPVFAELTKSFNPMRLIGVGLTVWTLAVAGCGLSWGFWSIVVCRCLVGVAEASFISLAAPFIDDYAPTQQRNAWLSIFYMCIPVGVALGYVFGGVVGGLWNWRVAFFAEALFMLPFAIFGFFSESIALKGNKTKTLPTDSSSLLKNNSEDVEGSPLGLETIIENPKGFLDDIKSLLRIKIYVVNALGYISYNFTLGAYSYWGPKAGAAIYKLDNADTLFGVMTIVAGIFGTLSGGLVLDRIGSTVPKAFKLLAWSSFFGGVFLCSAFFSNTLALFVPLFAVGEFLIFATQGPVNYITLHAVPSDLRPLAIAICTVAIHIFGDVPSSPIVGAVEDWLQNWKITALLLSTVVFVASAFWGVGSLLEAKDEMAVEERN